MSKYHLNLDKEFLERFEPERFLNYTDNYDVLTSALLDELKDITPSGRFTVQGQDSRPDLISFEIYGDVQYWWIILFYNGLSTVDQLINGMEITYPSISDLESYYFSLKARQA